jgi:hypothetical protein
VKRVTWRMIVVSHRDFLRGVRQRKATLGHHLDQIAQAQFVTQVPTNA